MILHGVILVALALTGMVSVAAQDVPPDSTEPPVLQPSDSLEVMPADSIGDSSAVAVPDSMMVFDESGVSFEERLEEFQEKQRRRPLLSLYDTLITYFASDRLNQRASLDRSFYHDAGDYFRFDPSYFVVEPQVTPMRKTVQPFGLRGDRLNLVSNGMVLTPFQHQPEPDGLTDLNLFPTAGDEDVFVMPGAASRLFGGRNAVAGLVTRPVRPTDNRPLTAILANKGSFGYSWVRGKYARRFAGGREIDASVGYREGDGLARGRYDDAYQYTGRMFFPLTASLGLNASGRALSRNGTITIRPDVGGLSQPRGTFDRSAEIALDWSGAESTSRYQFGYSYLRQGTSLYGTYKGRYDYTGHGALISAVRVSGRNLMSFRLEAGYIQYDNYFEFETRRHADLAVVLARVSDGLRYAFVGGARYDRDYEVLPNASLIVTRETERTLFLASVGYVEREPSMHETHLHPTRLTLYSGGSQNYADEGSPDLTKERQAVGSLMLELGSKSNNLRLAATGGSIMDGIDWYHSSESDSIGSYTLFKPRNGDVEFLDISAQSRLSKGNWLSLLTGGAWRKVEYSEADSAPYQPEYQVFGGLELHYFWQSKLTDLFLYGELVYHGPYDGYKAIDLGQDPVLNVKASIALKDFRFHFVWQNMLEYTYEMREGQTIPGRFFYYGLTWNFID